MQYPYYNPMQGYQPSQAYQPTIPQYQSNQVQPNALAGRFVSSPDEITPKEVSMSSMPSLFPLVDGSAIIAKQWANDGTIKTVRYSADSKVEDVPAVTLEDIAGQLDDMRDILDGMKRTQRKPTTRKKPEDAED